MDLYMLAEHDELYEFAEDLHKELCAWADAKTSIQVVYRSDELDAAPYSDREIELGIEFAFNPNKTQKLKEPLNTLNDLAKKHKCDFSVGIIDEGKRTDVCFFGFEEGRPDMFEIANYLSL